MDVARVTLSKAAELRRRHHYYYATITTIVVVGASGKKDERKLPKWGRDHDQNSVSICTATLMIYRLSFFSHHF